MDPSLSLPLILIDAWFRWGIAIGMAITLVAACWIFFDSQRRSLQAGVWRVISLVCAMVVAPSAVLFLFPELASGMGNMPLLLGYLGALATLISTISLILYTAGVGVVEGPLVGVLEEDPLPLPPPADSTTATNQTPPAPMINGRVSASSTTSGPITPPSAAPSPTPPLAWLVVMSGRFAGKEYRLGALTDIGRDSRYNDISIDDPAMSRQHARIRFESEGFVLYDLASVNGVYVNNRIEQRRRLEHGDRIIMGQTLFGFMLVRE
ncbi:MAG: FHA domain-containing protein [Chloroflexi bacterium]|nr:FHA domain-containing protein [Chloroflexota bacterium]